MTELSEIMRNLDIKANETQPYSVVKALKTDENYSDRKYHRASADAYDHATSWDTHRQVLSVIADLVPYQVIQLHIPGKNLL